MGRRAEYKGMKCRQVGESGLWVSEVGLGLWKWGDPSYDRSRVGEHEGFKILDRALELGVFHWDTANSYNLGSGNSERLLGRYFASRGRVVREQVVLATKVRNSPREEHVEKTVFTPNQSGGSRVYIKTAVDACLRRLRTDYIDLLYLHSPVTDQDGNYIVPLDETWGAMDDLITQGKVLYLAVSNHSNRQIADTADALASVAKDSSRRLVAVENRYSLLERDKVAVEKGGDEASFLKARSEDGISIVPFYPLASGMLTGRYRRDNLDSVSGRIIDDGGEKQWLTDRNLDAVEKLAKIAEDKAAASSGSPKPTLAQLAIAWLLSHEQVASVIAGVTRMEHVEDNARAPQLDLTAEDIARIEACV